MIEYFQNVWLCLPVFARGVFMFLGMLAAACVVPVLAGLPAYCISRWCGWLDAHDDWSTTAFILGLLTILAVVVAYALVWLILCAICPTCF